jgi:hypothetical protein
MDKLIFLFQRREGLTRRQFCDHYLDVHAPLGMRLTQTMRGYTVNLVDTEGGPAAITEIWTPSAADFLDPTRAFASASDAAELIADHDSFIGPFESYVVEEHVVRGGVLAAPLGRRTSGVKLVSLHCEAENLPVPPASSRRVVDHRVLKVLTPGARDLARIRMVWAPDAEGLGPLGADAALVREYRQLELDPVGH